MEGRGGQGLESGKRAEEVLHGISNHQILSCIFVRLSVELLTEP